MVHATHHKTKQLADELLGLFGDNLISVCEYGASVFEPFESDKLARHQNINVLVIVKYLNPADLEKASQVAKSWLKKANTLPIFMSQQEWAESQDIFALEYADMRDQHHVVYGDDFYSAVEVDKTSLRLVCELELHQKLVFMRQRWLVNREDPKQLLELMKETVNSFAALFRGILRLQISRDQIPFKSAEVFEKLPRLIPAFDPMPFLWVLKVKAGQEKAQLVETSEIYANLIQQLMIVVQYINQDSSVTTG